MSMSERAGRFVPLVIVVLCVGTVGVPRTEATEPPAKPEPKSAEEKKDDQVRRAAEHYVRLFVARDVKGLLKMADVPHYSNGNDNLHIARTRQELAQDLEEIRDRVHPRDLSIKVTRVTTWQAGRKSFQEGKRRQLDEVLEGGDRVVWLETTATSPGGKPLKHRTALLFRLRDGEMKWIGAIGE
jgi:hypothetical protein